MNDVLKSVPKSIREYLIYVEVPGQEKLINYDCNEYRFHFYSDVFFPNGKNTVCGNTLEECSRLMNRYKIETD